MKVYAFILLLSVCYVECKKIVLPIDKNANIAFINMEGGGVKPGAGKPIPAAPQPAMPLPLVPVKPVPALNPTPQPPPPKQAPTASPKPTVPTQIAPKPVNPPPATNPITTPGPGSVKQLVTFYDSQGKASPIRPYTYSQAVKQG